ncbi:transcriptional regulator, LacI family [Caminicella sporogenes DSM 14501]|uniref:Transcriptional regulator, LacI family n=1 Tax=Caminicella sporogenes DSM 14501 TaxID=1121266 RepID=A0A1M6MGA1_9FIRM|nr:LacI family DNA-binding transcriptional regulator [Caminicella sporogenes]RKD27565.1 LacI family transcriptional regulator [Caminicella sporogenes]WIF94851.1 LacI family DNA-binding transcriptional regulator [Caminicella sporogenes]SHJ82380.1 transcriptional regulator, LacI family [Caminicella sporogenes DSM 14501]
MAVTIKDVARKANVSISTVSRVINDSKPVSDEIRQRVLKVIEELGYTPNPVARSLVMKKSQLIGVIVPNISNYFIGEMLNGVEEIGKMYNYDILLCNSYGELEQELKYLSLLKSKQVEGIIFMTWNLKKEHKEFLEKIDIPVVMINRNTSDINIPSVCIDHFGAAYEMTNYLINKGHKKIALIRTGIGNDAFGVDQYKGYTKALKEHNIEIDESLIKNGDFKLEKAYDSVVEMIKNNNLPTAIFATSDYMAIGAMNALIDNGFKVPDDVSVVGFNDIKLASMYRPKLTTIKQPIYDIGAVAIRIIIKKIKGEEEDKTLFVLPHELIERDSCRSLV